MNLARFGRSARLFAAALVILIVAAGCANIPLEANWADMSLIDGRIMFAYFDRLVWVNPTDGSPVALRDSEGDVRLDDAGNPRLWDIRGGQNPPLHFYTTPIAEGDDTLLVAAYDRRLLTVDLPAARIVDPVGTPINGNIVADPVTTDAFVYVPLSDGDLVALDRETLDEVWRLETDKGIWASPLLVEDTLYVPSMNHNLYALDAQTGEVRWQLNLNGAIGATPVLHEGSLYVGSFARRMYQVSLEGEIISEFMTNEWVWGAPAIVDNTMYVGDLAGYVYALELTGDGFEQLWSRQVAGRAIRATPLVTDDTLIVGSRDHFVYWLGRETGEEIVRRELRGQVLSDLLLIEPSEEVNITEPYVIVSSMAREELMVAFSLDNGERRWVYGG